MAVSNRLGLTKAAADALYAALSHTHAASAIVSGQLALARGGTNADLSATGGANQFVKQTSAGGALSVAAILSADLTSALTTPPAIGGTTPSTGAFSLVTVTTATTPAIQPSTNSNTGLILNGATIALRGGSTGTVTFSVTGNGASLNAGTFGMPNGTAANPGYSFTNDADTGLYVASGDLMGVSAGGLQVGALGQTGTLLRALDAATNTVTAALTLQHNTSGTVAAGFGTSLAFQAESSTTDNQNVAVIEALWNVETHASRAGDLVLSSYNTTNKREGLRIRGGGSNTQIGFFGTTPVSRQTGYTTFANLSTDRTLDANSTSLDEVADVLGTLIEDLKALGLIAA